MRTCAQRAELKIKEQNKNIEKGTDNMSTLKTNRKTIEIYKIDISASVGLEQRGVNCF